MSDNPFDFDDGKEQDFEDYAYLEDDEKRREAGGCCVALLVPFATVAIGYELVCFFV